MPPIIYSLSGIAFVLVFLAFYCPIGMRNLARLGLVRKQSDKATDQLLAIPMGMGRAFLALFLLAATGQLICIAQGRWAAIRIAASQAIPTATIDALEPEKAPGWRLFCHD